MFRAATSTLVRRTAQQFARKLPTVGGGSGFRSFHPSLVRLETATPAPTKSDEKKEEGAKDALSLYGIPLLITAAVPIVHYEWYVFDGETLLAACFAGFVVILYNNFGTDIREFLLEDGRKWLAIHNQKEVEYQKEVEALLEDAKSQEGIVEDFQNLLKLRDITYERLNEAGKIKPSHEFKAQIERLLHLMEIEESNSREKMKASLMEEATAAVVQAFATDKTLKKDSLTMAVAHLKGSGAGAKDPVKEAYMKFFQEKAKAAAKVDEAAEAKAARAAMITKLNSVAMNEGFYFRFDNSGKPVMA